MTDQYTGSTHVVNPNGDDTARVGEILTRVINHGGDSDGVDWSVKPKITWFRDGVEIPGANEHKYAVTEADLGFTITAQYEHTDGVGDLNVAKAASGVFVTDDHFEFLKALYPYAFDREPDAVGMRVWADFMRHKDKTKDRVEVLEILAREFRSSPLYGEEEVIR